MFVGCGRTQTWQSCSSFSATQSDFLNRKGLLLTFAKIHTSVEKWLITSRGMCKGGCVLRTHEWVFVWQAGRPREITQEPNKPQTSVGIWLRYQLWVNYGQRSVRNAVCVRTCACARVHVVF